MIKGNLKKVAALSVAIAVTLGSTAFAEPEASSQQSSNPTKCEGIHKHKGEHKGEAFKKLMDQLGITKEEMKAGKESGKTLFDLAKAKGYTADQVREMLLKNIKEDIDKAVTEGKLTKEQGEAKYKKMSEKISKWDGTFKRHHDKCKDKKDSNMNNTNKQ